MQGNLLELKTNMLLEKFGAGNHKPGSGSAIALHGILSAQLVRTVIDLTKGRKDYQPFIFELLKIEAEINKIYPEMEKLLHDDAVYFDKVIALRRAREKEEEDLALKYKLKVEALEALKAAVEIPIQIANLCVKLIRMKLNWGAGIIIFIVLFMSFILTLVYKCTQQSEDLVSEKYYEQELLYQGQVDKKANEASLKEKLKVNYNKGNTSVEIQYPSTTDAAKLSGDIVFFKPDDANLDFTVNIHANQQLSQAIPSSKLAHGWWRLKINWSAAGTSYYQEEKILIN